MSLNSLLSLILAFILLLTAPQTAACEPAPDGLPDRAGLPGEYCWDLTAIYADEATWTADIAKVHALNKKIEKYRNIIVWSAVDLANCLELRDQINLLVGEKIYAWAQLHKDEDTKDSHYQALAGQAQTLAIESGTATAFIDPAITTIPAQQLKQFIKDEPRLTPYTFYLSELIRLKMHILPREQEELLSKISELAIAPTNIFTTLTNADVRFPRIKGVDGQIIQLSTGRYYNFITSPDREIRQNAFIAFQDTYSQYRNTLAATLDAHVKSTVFFAKARHYQTAIDATLFPNNIPVAVYDNLINTVSSHLTPLHKYIALKKKLLNLSEIHMYDLYAPLVGDIDWQVSYPEAQIIVRDALAPLGEDYQTNLDLALNNRWIDVIESRNKRSGAYSWGLYGLHPFILLNWNGQIHEVSTLAHELGHAMNSYYSNASQPFNTSGYSIFTAETASTVNENLLIEYLLNNTPDRKKRLYLLNQWLENIRTTVYRQTMFAEFEREIYRRVENGETLTADALDQYYHQLNVKYFGPDIVVDQEIDSEWSRIPHFYHSFYVYQYATGYSAATALAEGLLSGNPAARDCYLSFLAAGGSDYPISLLKSAGVDMSNPEPIILTLDKFNRLIGEFAQEISVQEGISVK